MGKKLDKLACIDWKFYIFYNLTISILEIDQSEITINYYLYQVLIFILELDIVYI